ncbi:MAG: RNA-binding domain-containing protein [Bacteroidia bacterium]
MTNNQLIQKLTELRSLPAETEVVEFKEAKQDYDFTKLGKYFSALCNEANLKATEEAWLVFGIENKRRNIVGSHYRSQSRPHLDSLKGEIANKTTHRITFIEIYELSLPEGRVVMLQIPPAPQGIPIAWEGHYYGRDGEELCPLNLEEIERIRKQVSRVDWSAGICHGASINDMDPKAIELAKKNFLIKNPRLAIEFVEWDDVTFLNKAKLTINKKITRTAILLLGLPESEHFISPGLARITWELRDINNISRDYEHFTCPLLLSVDQVYAKIRNLKYRYLKEGTLFPEEVDQYDPFNIKEALSNCIVHQDYTLGGRINVTEHEDARLIFSNEGEFLPGSVETVIESDEPPRFYRNAFLAQAMAGLNMIDTVGSGIKRMFQAQRSRFFPMPDYDLTGGKVKATLIGKILDMEYARVLARNPALTLEEIMVLDKVQKKKELAEHEIRHLRGKGLIEGRKPNYIISEQVAVTTGQFGNYLKNRGFDTAYYKKLLLEFILKNKVGVSKSDIRNLLWNKLPDILDDNQKEHKISRILRLLRQEKMIENLGSDAKPVWKSID